MDTNQERPAVDTLNGLQMRSTLDNASIVTPDKFVEDGTIQPPGSRFGVRHLQTCMASSFIAVNVFLQVNMSVAIISMTNLKHTSPRYPVYDWSEEIKDTILSSFFWGHPFLQIIGGNLAGKYGSKMIMAGGMAVASLTNIAFPYFAEKGLTAVCGSRAFQGAVQGVFFPCVAALLAEWIPPAERSTAVPLAFSGALLGAVGVFPLSGYLAETTFGWPSIFYVTSGIGFLWTLIWLLVGGSTPDDVPFISQNELRFIKVSLNRGKGKREVRLKTPWRKIWTSIPVWTLILVHIGQNWGYWTMIMQMPKYINSVLGIDIRGDGLLSALPYVCAWVMAVVYAWSSRIMQNHRIMSRTGQIKFWNSIALWGSSLILLIHGVMSPENSTLVISLLTLTMGIDAAVNNGLFANHVELSPNFGGTLMGITNTIATSSATLGPLTVGWIVHNPKSASDWKPVFILASAIMFVTNLVYVFLGSAEVQSWNDPQTVENSENRDSK